MTHTNPVDDELRAKINAINFKHMGNTGWNGKAHAEVYQAAMDEIMQLLLAWHSQGVGEAYNKGLLVGVEWHEQLKHTLIINRSDSKCGNCGRSADPDEKRHDTLLGYGDDNGHPGCRHFFKYVTSEYMGTEETVKNMRPDLEWVDNYPRMRLGRSQS